MSKILIVSNTPHDISHFYRSVGPLTETKHELVTVPPGQMTWAHAIGVDFAIMQRPDSSAHVAAATLLRNMNIPLRVDFDDALLDIPPDNPAYAHYARPSTREAIEACLRLATKHTVSTKRLQQDWLLDAEVLPNRPLRSLAPQLLNEQGVAERTTVYWRGSESHLADVLHFAPAVADGLGEGTPLHTFGWFAWPYTKYIQRVEHHGDQPMPNYFAELSELEPAICVVPLADNVFNRCKSNIAWVEATQAGAVTIAPEWKEWIGRGCLTYRSPTELSSALRTLRMDTNLRLKQLAIAREALTKLY